jgi:hypothetical protein
MGEAGRARVLEQFTGVRHLGEWVALIESCSTTDACCRRASSACSPTSRRGPVLDVGGWAKPMSRADWVLDLQPYATRGDYGYLGDPAAERFTEDTWVVRDICDHEPWPFADDAVRRRGLRAHARGHPRPGVGLPRAHRVARAGYVEVPSRLEEQTWGITGPWAGWAHHRWLCDVDPYAPRIDFVFKSHAVHLPRRCFPEGFHERLAPERRVQCFWWEGTFGFGERIFFDLAEHDAWLDAPIEAHRHELPRRGGAAWRGSRLPAMAGHSKWAGIKHKKAIVDARRGKLWTKLARAITVAAKEGGGDPKGNPALGLAVQKAKDASMPKDNIQRAIDKGTGAGADAENWEAVVYEGYGPAAWRCSSRR